MSDNIESEILVKIAAQTSELQAGLARAVAQVEAATAQMGAAAAGAAAENKAAANQIVESNQKTAFSFAALAAQVKASFAAVSAASVEGKTALLGAAQAAKSGAAELQAATGAGLAGSIGALSAAAGPIGFIAVAAAATIGTLKHAATSVMEYTGEIVKLAKYTGTSTEAASDFAVALKLVGISTDDYLGMAQRLVRQLKNNEEGLNAMGLKTRDASGHMRPLNDLMRDAVAVMGTYREGADRDAAAMEFFGRNAAEAGKLAKLTNEVLEKGSELAGQYGLRVTPEQIADMKKYKEQVNELSVAWEGFSHKLGEGAVPAILRVVKALNALMDLINKMPKWAVPEPQVQDSHLLKTAAELSGGLLAQRAAKEARAVAGADEFGAGLPSQAEAVKAGVTEGEGKAYEGDPKKIHAAELAAKKAALENDYALTKANADAEAALIKALYADGLLSVREFYLKKQALDQAATDARIQLLREEGKELRDLAAEQSARGDEAGQIETLSKIEKITTQITTEEIKRGEVIRANAEAEAAAASKEYEALLKEHEGLRGSVELASKVGDVYANLIERQGFLSAAIRTRAGIEAASEEAAAAITQARTSVKMSAIDMLRAGEIKAAKDAAEATIAAGGDRKKTEQTLADTLLGIDRQTTEKRKAVWTSLYSDLKAQAEKALTEYEKQAAKVIDLDKKIAENKTGKTAALAAIGAGTGTPGEQYDKLGSAFADLSDQASLAKATGNDERLLQVAAEQKRIAQEMLALKGDGLDQTSQEWKARQQITEAYDNEKRALESQRNAAAGAATDEKAKYESLSAQLTDVETKLKALNDAGLVKARVELDTASLAAAVGQIKAAFGNITATVGVAGGGALPAAGSALAGPAAAMAEAGVPVAQTGAAATGGSLSALFGGGAQPEVTVAGAPGVTRTTTESGGTSYSSGALDFYGGSKFGLSADQAASMIGGLPKYAMGSDYVPRTGLAMLHQGEKIVPAAQNRQMRAMVLNFPGMGTFHLQGDEHTAMRMQNVVRRESMKWRKG